LGKLEGGKASHKERRQARDKKRHLKPKTPKGRGEVTAQKPETVKLDRKKRRNPGGSVIAA